MDPEKLTKLVICATILFLGAVATLRGVRRNQTWLQSVAQEIFGAVVHLRTRWRKLSDPVEQRVATECSERRVGQARVTLAFAVCVGIVFEAFHMLRLTMDFPAMPLSQLVPIQGMVGGAMLLGLFPCLITVRTIDILFTWNILLVVAAIVAPTTEERYLHTEDLRLWVGAFCCCLFDLKPWLNAIGLVLITVACIIVGLPEAYAGWGMCLAELVMLCWIDCRLKAGVRLEIMATDSGQQLTAVNTLLGTICDVVVELDENLRMTQHSAKLSDVLLHGSGGRSLQGSTVQELMPEEGDREKFVENLSGADKAQTHAEVFHAKISDGDANQISMEFFSVAFVGPDTRQRHLLGMREFTDIQPLTPEIRALPALQNAALQNAAPPPERTARQWWPGTPASAEREEIAPHAPPQDAASEASSTSSRQAGAAPGAQPRMETDPVAKMASLMAMLMSWQFALPDGTCCPLHGRVAEAQRLMETMGGWGCSAAFGATGEWQCQRCGIMASEFREKGRRSARDGCILCKDLGLQGTRVGDVAAVVAL